MSLTASEMAALSLKARRKKHGGKEGFKKHMQAIAKLPRKKISTPQLLDSQRAHAKMIDRYVYAERFGHGATSPPDENENLYLLRAPILIFEISDGANAGVLFNERQSKCQVRRGADNKILDGVSIRC